MSFKVGDKVRIIVDDLYDCSQKIGTIVEAVDYEMYFVHIDCKDFNFFYYLYELEHISGLERVLDEL